MQYFLYVFLALSFCLFPSSLNAQSSNFEDGFEDGNFDNNPAWGGDTGHFTVINGSPTYLLQLRGNSQNGGVSYLSTSSSKVTGSWEFYIDLDFSPSGSNKAEVFLMSDIADLEGGVNGYALRAGERGSSDVFRIVRYDGGSEAATVLSGTTDISSGGAFRVKVTRQTAGKWTLEVGQGYDGTLSQEGSIQTDNTYSKANYFGVRATYSSSRADLFKFDFKIDLPPFTTTGAKQAGSQAIDVGFNRAVDQSSVSTADFSADHDFGTPSSVSFPSPDTVRLDFEETLPSNRYVISVSGVSDNSGNAIQAGSSESLVMFGTYTDNDVLINEFLYDPPDGQAEYVELINTSGKYLNLSGWSIGDDTSTESFGANPVVLAADSFLVISADTAVLSSAYGTRAYYELNQLSAFNNGGDAIQLRTGDDLLADSLTYTSEWNGTDVALERRSLTTPGIYPENWGPSQNASSGTPGLPNEVPADTSPPKILDSRITDHQTILLLFSERLESRSATNTSHYQLSPAVTINSVNVLEPDTVQLSLNSSLQNGTKYTLWTSAIEDIFGNAMPSKDINFTHYNISEADSGDLFINEFMFDPPEGSTEYIELVNPTNKSFDLRGWTINDNTGTLRTITRSQFVVPPDSFVVIAPDSTLTKQYPDLNLVTVGNQFPSLNNGGDEIVLRDAKGSLLDSLRYSSTWGGNSVSVERKSLSVASKFRENWAAPTSGTGSPGSANSVKPDQTAPTLLTANFLSASAIQLVFSKTVDPQDATDKSHYTTRPSVDIQLVSAAKDTITLFLSDDLSSGTTYEITASNLGDIFGNKLEAVSRTREYLLFSQPKPGDIVINEVLFERAVATGPEFVELHNRSDRNIDLSGWQFGDAVDRIDFNNIKLKAGGFLCLTGNKAFANDNSNVHYLPDIPSLNDDEDAVFIRTDDRLTIDSLYYHDRWGGGNGISIEREDPHAASNDSSNWTASSSQRGNSAGTKNNSFSPDETPPEVIFATRRADRQIEVHFNEFIQLTEDLAFLLNGAKLPIHAFDSTRGNQIVLQGSGTKTQKGNSPNINIRDLTDVKGNSTSSTSIALAKPVEPGSVVINEILFNPLRDSNDNLPDQSEYLELRNTRDYAISLEGFTLHDAPDENGEVQTLVPVSSTAKFLPANGHMLVYAEEQAITFTQSQTAVFFDLTGIHPNHTVRINRGSLSLASENDGIYLADSTGATIDSVFYDQSWHNPNIMDTKGVALERINPGGPSGDPANWSSSTVEKGGTPGTQNSIYQMPADQPEEIGISFAPNPFSPDGDGREDHLFINYKLDQPDYLLNVRIYDRYGRLVRELADGKQAGFEGSLQWDGLTDEGQRNRIGIYIVLFEAYNSSKGRDRTFKKTVVLARKL